MLSSKRRSHTRDTRGRKVLIGLTFAETREFEILDAQPPVDEHGNLLRFEIDEQPFPSNQARWLELYKKHREACEKRQKKLTAN
jgi:hypothetical protein